MDELPYEIIQHIQSFLDLKQGTRTILLSKLWLQAWSARPFLDFNISSFGEQYVPFRKLVDSTLQRYLDQRIPILKFRLNTHTLEDRWLTILKSNNIIELELKISGYFMTSSLWLQIFQSESIQVLKVERRFEAEIERWFESKLVISHSDIKCHTLRKLSLSSIDLDYASFQRIISSCPLVEDLVLQSCQLLKFRSADLPNLRFLTLSLLDFGSTVDISDSPTLRSVTVEGSLIFYIGSCLNLKRLALISAEINDEELQKILFQNPQLEDLTIHLCYKLNKRINLSSLFGLKSFKFNGFHTQVQEVVIDSPNLHQLEFTSSKSSTFPIITTGPLAKGNVNITIGYQDNQIILPWLQGLREFLLKFQKSNVKFCSVDPYPLKCNFRELRANSSCHWHHVETITIKTMFLRPRLLYAFLTICHPKTVIFESRTKRDNHAPLREICNTLSYREKLECCKFYKEKCWRHYIKDAQVYHVVGNEKRLLQINDLGTEYQMVISLDLEWEWPY